MREQYYLVTVYEYESEMDRDALSAKSGSGAILGVVERVGLGELKVFHSRAELLERLGFRTRYGDGGEAEKAPKRLDDDNIQRCPGKEDAE